MHLLARLVSSAVESIDARDIETKMGRWYDYNYWEDMEEELFYNGLK